MIALVSLAALQTAENAFGQALAPPPTLPLPPGVSVAGSSTVEEQTDIADGQNPSRDKAVIQVFDPSTIASVAATSGVSGTSETGGFGAANHSYEQVIGRVVNANAFLPTDNITDTPAIVLLSLRTNGWWDVSASLAAAMNYDSNITRVPNTQSYFSDFYEHSSASVNFRFGVDSTPLELQLGYTYDADVFTRYDQFNTFTHSLNFQARIGRSNVKWFPYFTGSFRSVQTPAAASGREQYDYLQEGVRGEEDIFPNLVHTYDFSHTSVVYGQRVGDNFQIWRLYQELDFKPYLRMTPARFPGPTDSAVLYPWLEMKETAPTNFAGVNELNGGVGGRVNLGDKVDFEARGGWGGVQSDDPSVARGSFSGARYNAVFDYHPLPEVRFRLSDDRVLTFTPTTVGRDVNVVDAVIEFPLSIDGHFVVVPALELYRADSSDYQDFEHAFFPEPSLQVNYQLNDHFAAFLKTQYRATEDTQFETSTNVKVLQTTSGITTTF